MGVLKFGDDLGAGCTVQVATYTPTGSMPILLPEEVKGNRSTRVVNQVIEDD